MIVRTFTLIVGEEPNYQRIENGAAKGIAKACFAFCCEQIDYLRIDTHRENPTMQAAIQQFGFRKCGTIFVENGTERIAYDYLK